MPDKTALLFKIFMLSVTVCRKMQPVSLSPLKYWKCWHMVQTVWPAVSVFFLRIGVNGSMSWHFMHCFALASLRTWCGRQTSQSW